MKKGLQDRHIGNQNARQPHSPELLYPSCSDERREFNYTWISRYKQTQLDQLLTSMAFDWILRLAEKRV
jgi:hypothetical protein